MYTGRAPPDRDRSRISCLYVTHLGTLKPWRRINLKAYESKYQALTANNFSTLVTTFMDEPEARLIMKQTERSLSNFGLPHSICIESSATGHVVP